MSDENDAGRRPSAREERRTLRDEIRRSVHEGMGRDIGKHIGKTIKDSMSFNIDLGDLDFGGRPPLGDVALAHEMIDAAAPAQAGREVPDVFGDATRVGVVVGGYERDLHLPACFP